MINNIGGVRQNYIIFCNIPPKEAIASGQVKLLITETYFMQVS
ncbi:MAG: hypothetical protein RMX68_024010 [Aulosira sp. ZfuVER01]|nr:hypothetical protein [Aulosira sp. ZfuVER01]MDZ8000345.1 hypothetical protein [Aulosira sp. DedVER01a]MDZ8050253.1 hypothetical protein [Aulosira sp. ZfuCHP01]